MITCKIWNDDLFSSKKGSLPSIYFKNCNIAINFVKSSKILDMTIEKKTPNAKHKHVLEVQE